MNDHKHLFIGVGVEVLSKNFIYSHKLQNCVEQCVLVRVVRGHECKSSYCGKLYTYDGLYKVKSSEACSLRFTSYDVNKLLLSL